MVFGGMKKFKYSRLCDFYGCLLASSQFRVIRDYYDNDLTLSEIASQSGVSRQSVYRVRVQAEEKLDYYEEKLGLLKIIEKSKDFLGRVQVEKLQDLILHIDNGVKI